jgi:beta-xylosidase
MRQGIVILMVLSALLLSACGGAPEAEQVPSAPTATAEEPVPTETPKPADTPAQEAPTAMPEPTDTPAPEEPSPTPEPTSTLEPVATPEPTEAAEPTATLVSTEPAEPTVAPTTGPVVVFRDDFEGALAGGWAWENEDPSHWNLTDVPGSLRIVLQDGGINWPTPARNVLLRQPPTGTFEIETLVRFTPSSDFQFAGLVIYQDGNTGLQLGRAFCAPKETCVGNGVYFDNLMGDGRVGSNFATATASQSQAYLRLRCEGSTYTGYYSEDGTNWTVIGQHTNPLNPLRVGLIAAQAAQAETTADFDYFTITTLP